LITGKVDDSSASPSDTKQQGTAEITREQLVLGKRLLNWRTLLPLLVVIVALVIFAQRENINPQKTWDVIRSANLFFFLVAFVIYYCSFAIRALRWRLLLENVGFTRANGIQLPKFWKLVEIIYISFFANGVVPAKLGDLYRAYLLRQEIGVSTTRSFGTVLAERLLDLIVLLLLFIPAILISLHANMPSQLHVSLEIMLAVVVVGIIGLFALRVAREPIAKLVPQRFRAHYYHFQEGTLGSFRRVPVLTGLTAGVWTCEALRFFFVAISLSLISGSFIHVLAAAVVIGLGEALLTALPTTGGGIGLVEGGMVAMIALFYQGPNAVNLTAAAILLDRAISLFSVLLIGLVIFLIEFGRKATR
jgi:glycosyltransferase 2 family protein